MDLIQDFLAVVGVLLVLIEIQLFLTAHLARRRRYVDIPPRGDSSNLIPLIDKVPRNALDKEPVRLAGHFLFFKPEILVIDRERVTRTDGYKVVVSIARSQPPDSWNP